MKRQNHHPPTAEEASEIYAAFLGLNRGERRCVALRMLGNQRLLRDLYDHFLIQRAVNEKGRSISLKHYRRSPKPVTS